MNAFLAYRRLLLFVVFLSAAGIFLGAYVRLSNAGLGCPDWPGCYGHFWIPKATEDIHSSEKIYGATFFSGLASREMIHRYVVFMLGMFVVALFLLSFFAHSVLDNLYEERPWTVSLLLLVVVQGLFGMWTVTLKLLPIIVTMHLMGGMLTFCLAVWMLCRISHVSEVIIAKSLHLRLLSMLVLLILILQILLGGWVSTNYAGLSCESLFKCNGEIVPTMDFSSAFSLKPHHSSMILSPIAQMTVLWLHRSWAIFVAIGVLFLASRLYVQRCIMLSTAMVCLLCLQVIFGISNVVFHLPKWIAVAHTFCAAMLLASVLVANYLVFCSCSKSG